MKRQLRKMVFETNSSSAHSIVVTKNDVHVKPEEFHKDSNSLERIYLNNKGIWEIAWHEEDLSFDRCPMNLLTTVEDKARYVFADYCGYGANPEKVEEITEVLKKIIPGLQGIEFPKKDVEAYEHEDGTLVDPKIKVHSDWDDDGLHYYYIKDGEQVPVKSSKTYFRRENSYGYVDHQSHGLVENFLRHQNISLEEFLTNRKYVIVIDGDEYDFWANFKYSGLIDVDNIESEFSGSNEDLSYSGMSDEDTE